MVTRMPYTKGPEIRIWFLVKVEEARLREAEINLYHLACDQQWTGDWSIRKIERIHAEESRRLGAFAPKPDCEYDFFILIKAKDRATLLNQALPGVSKAVGRNPGAPGAYIIDCAFDMDGH